MLLCESFLSKMDKMIDQEFLTRIETAQESITWQDLKFIKTKGTVDCPFCLVKNKGYLYDNYFKCFMRF